METCVFLSKHFFRSLCLTKKAIQFHDVTWDNWVLYLFLRVFFINTKNDEIIYLEAFCKQLKMHCKSSIAQKMDLRFLNLDIKTTQVQKNNAYGGLDNGNYRNFDFKNIKAILLPIL